MSKTLAPHIPTSCSGTVRRLSDETVASKLGSFIEPIFHSPTVNRQISQGHWAQNLHSTNYSAGMFGGIINRINSSPPLKHWINNSNQNHHVPSTAPFTTSLSTTRHSDSEPSLSTINNQMLTDHWESWKQIHHATLNNNINPHFLTLYPSSGYPTEFQNTHRRKNATRETTSILKAWLNQHKKNPYPTKGEKIMLALITKMTLTQVSTWFANARRRLKKENKMTWTARTRHENGTDEICEIDEDDDNDDENDIGEEDDNLSGKVNETKDKILKSICRLDNNQLKITEKPLKSEKSEIINEESSKSKIWSIAEIVDDNYYSPISGHQSDLSVFPANMNLFRLPATSNQCSDHLKLLQSMTISPFPSCFPSPIHASYRNILKSWSLFSLTHRNPEQLSWYPGLNLTGDKLSQKDVNSEFPISSEIPLDSDLYSDHSSNISKSKD